MTYQERQKFETLLNTVLNNLKESRSNNLTFNITTSQLNELVTTAKRKNKLNNYFLKDNDKDNNVVCSYSCLDTNSNNLVTIAVRPNEKNTVKQIFVYEVLNSQFATKQEYTFFKNNPL